MPQHGNPFRRVAAVVNPAQRIGCGLSSVLLYVMTCVAMPSHAASPVGAIDLGDHHARVAQRLGAPLRAWFPSRCPENRIELRRRNGLWLKLVYGPDDRVLAAGIIRLDPIANPAGRKRPGVMLRWPGLRPGIAVRQAYPGPEHWRPLLWSLGAKQWLWLEEYSGPPIPTDRSSYLGGIVVDDASAFAAGTGFPHDVAEAVTATRLSSDDWIRTAWVRPLLSWRLRTPPNTYIETRTTIDRPALACDALTLAIPDYTDFLGIRQPSRHDGRKGRTQPKRPHNRIHRHEPDDRSLRLPGCRADHDRLERSGAVCGRGATHSRDAL